MVDRVDGFFQTYKRIADKPQCMKLYLCRLAVTQDVFQEDGNELLNQLYMYVIPPFSCWKLFLFIVCLR